jgi:hypothetical protein
MANSYPTVTFAVDPNELLRWTKHLDTDRITRESKAYAFTSSKHDWLMSEISAFSSSLQLSAVSWLATASEAPLRTTEHLDSKGYWWFVWVLYREEIQASIADLDEIIRLAQETPQMFGASPADVSAAINLDSQRDELNFEIPDASGDGDDPTYVICSILAFRRLLTLAYSNNMTVVHMRYSFRPQ